MKTYHLKPFTTPATLATDPLPRKPHPNTPAGGWQTHLLAGRPAESFPLIPPSPLPRRV